MFETKILGVLVIIVLWLTVLYLWARAVWPFLRRIWQERSTSDMVTQETEEEPPMQRQRDWPTMSCLPLWGPFFFSVAKETGK